VENLENQKISLDMPMRVNLCTAEEELNLL